MTWRRDLILAALIGAVLGGLFAGGFLGFILTGKKES